MGLSFSGWRGIHLPEAIGPSVDDDNHISHKFNRQNLMMMIIPPANLRRQPLGQPGLGVVGREERFPAGRRQGSRHRRESRRVWWSECSPT